MSQRAYQGIFEGVLGADEFSRKIRALAQAFPDIAARALAEEATLELADAVAHTPIGGLGDRHAGQLRESGHITPFTDPSGMSVAISFNTPYAVAEHQKYYHHPRGGHRLYLLRVMEAAKPYLLENVGHRIQADLEALMHYGV
jgi:hypothetical protein